jgi:hypothetical protein
MFRDLAVFARNRSKLLAIALGGRRNYNLSKKRVAQLSFMENAQKKDS